MRRDVLERVGPLDERFGIGMFEDDDYARRIRGAGYRLVCAGTRSSITKAASSFKLLGEPQYLSVFEKNRRLYGAKWGPWEPHVALSRKAENPELRERLAQILASADTDRVVIMLPSIGWNSSLVQRPHHLATELARQGYLVLFDCTGSHIDHFADFVRIADRLYIYKGPQGVLDTVPRPIVWAFPYNAHLVSRWPNCTVVYDLIDDLSVFPYRAAFLRDNHATMLERADSVFYVASGWGICSTTGKMPCICQTPLSTRDSRSRQRTVCSTPGFTNSPSRPADRRLLRCARKLAGCPDADAVARER